MKIKKEYIVLAVLILGLSLYIMLRNPDKTHFQLPNLPKIDRADISRVEIAKKDGVIIMNKKDETWYIAPEEFPVSDYQIKSILDTIQDFKVMALVSRSKNYSRYDLDDDKKITVKAWTGTSPILEFEVGKTTEEYRQTFVKLGDDSRVYHVKGNLKNKFDQTVGSLRDKTVLAFDTAEIQEITLAVGDKELVLNRKQVPPVQAGSDQSAEGQTEEQPKPRPLWKSVDGKEADEAKLNGMLKTLSNLRCQEYIEDKREDDFSDPIYTVQLKGVNEYTLSIFAKADEKAQKYPSISSQNNYPFMLFEWQTKRIMLDPNELLGS
jgi:hypothetical protein